LTATAVLVACGGGGSSSPNPPLGQVTPTPTATPSKAPQSYVVGGTVVQLPVDGYGPTTIDGISYQSADATQTSPLNGATVVVGPVPIVGATAPATLPTGDVAATTNASGAFTATLAVAPTAPSSAEPFVVPPDNLSGTTPPATGYYVQVFGVGTDGLSAGTLLPVHRFLAMSTSLALRITTASSAEAAALAAVNSDRASNAGAGPLIFDESAEEVARLHASDESNQGYYCHYDTKNVGPSSRYLASVGLGLTGEALALPGSGVSTAVAAFEDAEAEFLAEKSDTPPGAHYTNLVDSGHLWAGLAAVPTNEFSGGFYAVDYDLVTPNDEDTTVGVAGYSTASTCPPGTAFNNS
jgi:uncharacterized protein YkwD